MNADNNLKDVPNKDAEFQRIYSLISNRNSLPIDPRIEDLKEIDRIIKFIVPSSEFDIK